MAVAVVFEVMPGTAVQLNLNFGVGFHLYQKPSSLGKDLCLHTSVYVVAYYHNLVKALVLDVALVLDEEVTSVAVISRCLDTL